MAKIALLLAALLLSGCASHGTTPPERDAKGSFALREVAGGFDAPVDLVSARDGTDVLYVVEQAGKVWALSNGVKAAAPLLDITSKVKSGGEQGLLSVAFAPDYATSGVLYASYTDLAGDTTITRETPATRQGETIFHLHQPYANHTGGDLVWGPDGKLWLGLGDGGSEGDPQGNGQNATSLLASLLKLDPATGHATLWAKGLRNPWRFSFDRATGDLWIGDVGQNRWEEVDHVAAPLPADGPNFGWNADEGMHPYDSGTTPFSRVTAPVAEYGHDEGCSVTGGFVYRGSAVPALAGTYLFSDACTGHVWGYRDGTLTRLAETNASIVSFGEDDHGELYLVDHAGRILEIVPI